MNMIIIIFCVIVIIIVLMIVVLLTTVSVIVGIVSIVIVGVSVTVTILNFLQGGVQFNIHEGLANMTQEADEKLRHPDLDGRPANHAPPLLFIIEVLHDLRQTLHTKTM